MSKPISSIDSMRRLRLQKTRLRRATSISLRAAESRTASCASRSGLGRGMSNELTSTAAARVLPLVVDGHELVDGDALAASEHQDAATVDDLLDGAGAGDRLGVGLVVAAPEAFGGLAQL